MDWFNFKEFIGCILLEQALGTQYSVLYRLDNAIAETGNLKRLNWWREKFDAEPIKVEDIYMYSKSIGRISTIIAVILLYVSLDFFLNVF